MLECELCLDEKATCRKIMDKVRWSMGTLSEICEYKSGITLASAKHYISIYHDGYNLRKIMREVRHEESQGV